MKWFQDAGIEASACARKLRLRLRLRLRVIRLMPEKPEIVCGQIRYLAISKMAATGRQVFNREKVGFVLRMQA